MIGDARGIFLAIRTSCVRLAFPASVKGKKNGMSLVRLCV
jgi:hypothetical protein